MDWPLSCTRLLASECRIRQNFDFSPPLYYHRFSKLQTDVEQPGPSQLNVFLIYRSTENYYLNDAQYAVEIESRELPKPFKYNLFFCKTCMMYLAEFEIQKRVHSCFRRQFPFELVSMYSANVAQKYSPYTCPHCDIKLCTFDIFSDHLREVHDDLYERFLHILEFASEEFSASSILDPDAAMQCVILQCELCLASFPDDMLMIHYSMHPETNIKKCFYCDDDTAFDNLRSLFVHLKTAHPPKNVQTMQCGFCDEICNNQTMYVHHLMYDCTYSTTCNSCTTLSDDQTTGMHHFRHAPQDRTLLACARCGFRTVSFASMDSHACKCTIPDVFRCLLCVDTILWDDSEILRHFKHKHFKDNTCLLCKKPVPNVLRLSHAKQHFAKGPLSMFNTQLRCITKWPNLGRYMHSRIGPFVMLSPQEAFYEIMSNDPLVFATRNTNNM